MNLPRSAATSALLTLPAAIYGAAVRRRNRYYDDPRRAIRVPMPVLSVGNLAVGGTGKTPLVAWLVGRLQERGRKPAVVTRGYGGRAGRGPLSVSLGDGPLVASSICGDEPWLLGRRLRGALVIAGSDRVAGAAFARSRGADVVVLDDGFQHRRLHRDLDLVLLDGARPFGNGRLLPAGPLREPVDSLRRADVVVVTRTAPGEDVSAVARALAEIDAACAVVRAGHRRVGFVDVDGMPVARPVRAVAFCGIATPDGFRRDLQEEGVDLAGFLAFPDHHPWAAEDIRRLRDAALSQNAALATTEKDLARLDPPARAALAAAVVALAIEAVVHDEDALLSRVDRALATAPA